MQERNTEWVAMTQGREPLLPLSTMTGSVFSVDFKPQIFKTWKLAIPMLLLRIRLEKTLYKISNLCRQTDKNKSKILTPTLRLWLCRVWAVVFQAGGTRSQSTSYWWHLTEMAPLKRDNLCCKTHYPSKKGEAHLRYSPMVIRSGNTSLIKISFTSFQWCDPTYGNLP